jgi:histidinol phosphatase-like PHP family hydrolase
MVKQALKMRYSFVAITDHHFMDTKVCKDVIQQCRAERRLLCIPGMEVTGRLHLLAIGISKSIDKNLPIVAQVQEIHKQSGFAIAAHPFALPRYSDKELFESGLDAIECGGIPLEERPHFVEMEKEHPIPCVYDSDAHTYFQMQVFNICKGKITTFDDLKKAYHENRCW